MIDHKGIKWILYHGALVPDAAPHVATPLSAEDQAALLAETGARFLRWHEDFDRPDPTEYWHVIKSEPEDLGSFSKNTRNQVRKGLRNFSVDRMDPADLARDGYRVYRQAMLSYRTDLAMMDRASFRDHLAAAATDASLEFWGVRDSTGRLVAYAQNRIQDGTCNYQVIKLDPAHTRLYCGYALIHTMNVHYLNEREVEYVNDGSRSIRHETGIQDFLVRKFRFRRAYSNLRISYAPPLGTALRIIRPLRSATPMLPPRLRRKVEALLTQEEIRKSCE